MDNTFEALQDLYDIIEKCKRRNVNLPDDVIHQINETEEYIIRDAILPIIGQDIEPTLSQIKRDLVLVVEYHPGEPISVALSRKTKISQIVDAKPIVAKSISASIPRICIINHENSIKSKFEEWLLSRVAPNTTKSYLSFLNSSVRFFIKKYVDSEADSVYSFIALDEMQKCKEILESKKDYLMKNAATHNGMSASIKKWVEFLVYVSNNNKPKIRKQSQWQSQWQ